MARKTLLIALTSFAVIVLLIPLVRFLVPGSISGFQAMCPTGTYPDTNGKCGCKAGYDKDASGNCVKKESPGLSDETILTAIIIGSIVGIALFLYLIIAARATFIKKE
jgi:hypothetical protein